MTTKTVAFAEPVPSPYKDHPPIAQIEVKQPSGGDFLDIGEPLIWSRTADGAVFSVEDKSRISAYLDRCIVHEGGVAILRKASLHDVRAVKECLLSFFDGAEKTSAA